MVSITLGLDVSTKTGWSVCNDKGKLLAYGLIKLKPKDLKSRLDILTTEIKEIIIKHKVTCLVIEEVFHGVNPKVTALLNKFQGAIVAHIPVAHTVIFVNASSARKHVLGQGTKYTKQDVYDWAVKTYKLNDFEFTSHNDITDSILLCNYGIKKDACT